MKYILIALILVSVPAQAGKIHKICNSILQTVTLYQYGAPSYLADLPVRPLRWYRYTVGGRFSYFGYLKTEYGELNMDAYSNGIELDLMYTDGSKGYKMVSAKKIVEIQAQYPDMKIQPVYDYYPNQEPDGTRLAGRIEFSLMKSGQESLENYQERARTFIQFLFGDL